MSKFPLIEQLINESSEILKTEAILSRIESALAAAPVVYGAMSDNNAVIYHPYTRHEKDGDTHTARLLIIQEIRRAVSKEEIKNHIDHFDKHQAVTGSITLLRRILENGIKS